MEVKHEERILQDGHLEHTEGKGNRTVGQIAKREPGDHSRSAGAIIWKKDLEVMK
jgi:hypothetical protein